MPARLDLTNQTQPNGRLTARSINPEESRKRGQPCWNCDCSCGGTAVVTAKAFQSGHTRSCKCLVIEAARGNLPPPAELRRGYKGKGLQERNGRRYVSLMATADILGVTHVTLRNWAKQAGDGCPWLDGEVLPTTPLPIGNGRTAAFVAETDIERVRAARAARLRVPGVQGGTYLPDVAKDLGISERAVRKRVRRAGGEMKKQTARGRDGKPRRRTYVPTKLRSVFADPRELPPVPGDRMTAKAAAVRLGRNTATVYKYIAAGDLVAADPAAVPIPGCRSPRGKLSRYPREVVTVTTESVRLLEAKWRGEAATAGGRLAPLPPPIAPPPSEEGYVPSAEACRITGLRPYEITRLCQAGKVRFRKPSPRRLMVHLGDLARHVRS